MSPDEREFFYLQHQIEIDRLKDRLRVALAERDIARTRADHGVQILTRVFALLPPQPFFQASTGKTLVFRDPDPERQARLFDMLAAEIRAIPDRLAAEAVQEFHSSREVLAAQSAAQAQTTGVPSIKT